MLATFKTCIARALFIPPLPLSRARIHSSHSTHGRIDISQLRSPIVCRNILHVSSVNVPRPNRFLEFCQNTVTYFFFFFFSPRQKFPLLIFLDSEAKRGFSFPRDSVLSPPINLRGMLSGASISFDSIVH